MTRTLTSENTRKTLLFAAWISYLHKLHTDDYVESFDEIYEGTATVSCVSKNRIGLHLETGIKIRNIPIEPEISKHSCGLDIMFVVLGRRKDRWWPIDVISIGSILFGKSNQAHLTVNPLYVNDCKFTSNDVN